MTRQTSNEKSARKRFPPAIFLLLLAASVIIPAPANQDEILFPTRFSDLDTQWTVWDDPEGLNNIKKSIWQAGLTELSGIKNRDGKPATMLLAGETSWRNYALETSLFQDSSRSYLTGIVFGWGDDQHFYVAGYNFELKRFEMEARTPEGFDLLAHYNLPFPQKREVPLRLEFSGPRIRLLSGDTTIFDLSDGRYQSGRFGLCTSNLGSGRLLFGPVEVSALDAKLPDPSTADLLAANRGAVVLSSVDTKNFQRLIDHKNDLLSREASDSTALRIKFTENPLPLEAVFAFPLEKEVEIRQVAVKTASQNFPGKVEFLVSQNSSDASFQSLGSMDIKPERDTLQSLDVPFTKARYLKFRILSMSEPGADRIELAEIMAFGSFLFPDVSPDQAAGPSPATAFEDNFDSGLSRWDVRDLSGASPEQSRWTTVLSEYSRIRNILNKPATMLLAGDPEWSDYSVETNMYVNSAIGYLTGMVLGYKGPGNYLSAGYNLYQKTYELELRTASGYETLAKVEMEIPRGEWIPLKAEFTKDRLRFTSGNTVVFDLEDGLFDGGRCGLLTSNQGLGQVLFSGFTVKPQGPDGLPQRRFDDLLSAKSGASVIYRKAPPRGEPMQDLYDHEAAPSNQMGNVFDLDLSKVSLPEEAVFCFPQTRYAEIHRIGLKLSRDNFPGEINFFTSEQTPKSGFSLLAGFQVKPEAGSYQEISVPPTRAKYLKIQIARSSDPKRVRCEEILVKGYLLEKAERRAHEGDFLEIALREKEVNNSEGQAQSLPLGTDLRGEAGGEDVDFFKITIEEDSQLLDLELESADIVAPGYMLLNSGGAALEATGQRTEGTVTLVSYSLPAGEYFLKIWRPEAYLTIVYDDSGSMNKSIATVKTTLMGYLNRLGHGLNLQLMKYMSNPIILSEFTSDPEILKKAIEEGVRGGGGTDTFKGLTAAVESVAAQPGARAVLAIFDVIDCPAGCEESYIRLWDLLLDNRVSFNTIGVQAGWEGKTRYFNTTKEQIFREIAFATQGRFFHTPLESQVQASADEIFRRLTSATIYRIRAEARILEKKPGGLEIGFQEGSEKQASKNTEIILDSSNSMWGQIGGQAKITIAKEVLSRIIGSLAGEMRVGLRVYGHRFGLNDPKACTDSELVIPIGPLDKNAITAAIQNIQPRGKTPLVHSVLASAGDFADKPSGSIILISDGIESCGGDIAAIAPAMEEAGLDLRVNIIGFDIKEESARRQLEDIASSTGGIYLDAKDSGELMDSLEQTLKIEYLVLNSSGEVKAQGFIGDKPFELQEGDYTLRILLEPEPLERKIRILPGKTSRLTLEKSSGGWILKD